MPTHVSGRELDVLSIQQGCLLQAAVVFSLQACVEALLVVVNQLVALPFHTKRITSCVLEAHFTTCTLPPDNLATKFHVQRRPHQQPYQTASALPPRAGLLVREPSPQCVQPLLVGGVFPPFYPSLPSHEGSLPMRVIL
eukprot:1157664-Pelagomonas_calceolata.AAC.12